MVLNHYVLIGYAVFLGLIAVINLLYFFEVFRYRLPGDASLGIVVIHIILLLTILTLTTLYLGFI